MARKQKEKKPRAHRKGTATEQLLRLIDSTPGGMRFTEIQRAMWLLKNPGGDVRTMSRGHYCTYFLGGPWYHAGVLRFFCIKDPQTGRWVRNPAVEIKGPWKRPFGYGRLLAAVDDDSGGYWL